MSDFSNITLFKNSLFAVRYLGWLVSLPDGKMGTPYSGGLEFLPPP